MNQQVEFTLTSQRPFEELIAAVQETALQKSFRTLHVHDVQATLKEKGFSIMPYSIIEVCNAAYANEAIQAYAGIGMFLPCRIAVYDSGRERTLTMMNPSMMTSVLPAANFGDLPQKVETLLQEVMKEAAE